ncbi:MAG: class I SAM-dependent methyltransferase [Pseudomonadota bacterium]
MSGFDPEWLALREPADRRARDTALLTAAGRDLAGHSVPLVCDLGAGTGAGMRAFAPFFPDDTRWLLVDGDQICLDIAAGEAGFALTTKLVDLSQDLRPWTAETRLVTTTALLDLASASWIAGLVSLLAEASLPFLACLSFDGRMQFSPAHPLDNAIAEGFAAHQQTDKGLGGPATGPEAASVLIAALEQHGYHVDHGDSAWALQAADDGPLIKALVAGIAHAAADSGGVDPVRANAWLEQRLSTLDAVLIGHLDVYAVPPKAA